MYTFPKQSPQRWPFLLHICTTYIHSIFVSYLFHISFIFLSYLFPICFIYVPYLFYICFIFVPYLLQNCLIFVPYFYLYICFIFVPYSSHTYFLSPSRVPDSCPRGRPRPGATKVEPRELVNLDIY